LEDEGGEAAVRSAPAAVGEDEEDAEVRPEEAQG